MQRCKTNDHFKLLQKSIIEKYNYLKNINKLSDTKIIDMGHHTIRYSSMIIYLFITIIINEINNKDTDIKKQIMAKFYKIKNKEMLETCEWKTYNYHLKNYNISILKISNNGKDYDKYYRILIEFMNDVKNKITKILDNNLNMICPFESVILQYMIQIEKNGIYAEISINELYNIIDIYSKSFKNNMEGHDQCLCKKHFSNNNINNNNKYFKTQEYLMGHYEKIYNIGKLYHKFLSDIPKVSWLIDHSIIYNGKNDDFEIKQKYQLIGYNNEDVYIVYLKPQFNSLNYNNILIDSIYDTFILNNIKNPNTDDNNTKINNDYKRFANKNIKTILFSLDQNDYFIFDWKNKDENLILINNKLIIENIRNILLNKLIIECKYIYYYYKYFKNLNDNLKNPDKPYNLIKKIINEIKIDKNKDKFPHFIIKFFENIERDIKRCKNDIQKENQLNFYCDENNFLEELNETIKISINEYLYIEDEDY